MGPKAEIKALKKQLAQSSKNFEKMFDQYRGAVERCAALEEQLTNQNLAYVIAKRDADQLREWASLNKPVLLKLLDATNQHNLLVAAAATQRAEALKLPRRSSFEGRRSPHVKARSPLIPVPRRDGTLGKKRKAKK